MFMNNENKTFKVVLVGEAQSGKTTFLRRHLTGEYTKNYVPTLGVEVHPLTFNTNRGFITFNCWGCAGDEKFKGLGEGYYIGADAALVFFDSNNPNKTTWRNITTHTREVLWVIGQTKPIVYCATKVEDVAVAATSPQLGEFFSRLSPVPRFLISSKSNYHYELPFLTLARKLLNDESVVFTEMPAKAPPEVVIDPVKMAEYAKHLDKGTRKTRDSVVHRPLTRSQTKVV